jgi:hypothetical protein
MDIADPMFTKSNTEQALAMRAKLRKLMLLPTCTAAKTLKVLPSVAPRPKRDRLEPILAYDLTLMLDPMCV